MNIKQKLMNKSKYQFSQTENDYDLKQYGEQLCTD